MPEPAKKVAHTTKDAEPVESQDRIQAMGRSWMVMKQWDDSSGKGEERYCSLCHKWWSQGHESSQKHKARALNHGFKKDDGVSKTTPAIASSTASSSTKKPSTALDPATLATMAMQFGGYR